MSGEWTDITCHGCGGHGIVSDYGDGEDFYGPTECKVCDGRGVLSRSANGALAVYPGGPFCGRDTSALSPPNQPQTEEAK